MPWPREKWNQMPIFAMDADITVYWPEVRPEYEAWSGHKQCTSDDEADIMRA